MTQLHFGVKQLKIDRTMGVLYSFGWNHVNTLTWRVFAETVTYIKLHAIAVISKESNYFRHTRLLVCCNCSIRVYRLFVSKYMNVLLIASYYAGIMLTAFSDLLCSKLCWHYAYCFQ